MVMMGNGGTRRAAGRLAGWVWLAAVWAAAPAGPARAQQAPAVEQARQRMAEGQEHYQAGRYGEAAQAFMKAYEAKPMAAFLYNAAMAYEKRGEPGKAADHYARYLAEAPDAPDAAEVRSRIERLRTAQAGQEGGTGIDIVTRTERRTVRVERGEGEGPAAQPEEAEADPRPEARAPEPEDMKSMVSIQATPRGAAIRVHGAAGVVARGRSPFLQTLAPGSYDVVIEREGYRTVERRVTVAPGKVYTVIVEMSQAQFTGMLRVASSPPGATVYLDDREQGAVGTTPWQDQLAAGEHTLWLEAPGYQPQELTVAVEAGQETPVEAQLERLPYGRLRIVANVRDARVTVDDRVVGTVPWEGQLEAGPHRILVEAEGRKPYATNVVVAPGQLTPVRVKLRQAVPRGGAWTSAVLAGLVLGAGATLAIMSEQRFDTLRHEANDGILASNDDRLFKGRMLAIGADAAFGLGGLLALVSLYYFVRDPLPDSEGTVLEPRDWALNPEVSPTGAGAQLLWRF